ncbi:hypothetical protein ACFLWR_05865 [Chloroflexota bacterium]
MPGDTDTTKEKRWLSGTRVQTVIKNLTKKHINARYASSRTEALSAIMEMIPDGATVTRGIQ